MCGLNTIPDSIRPECAYDKVSCSVIILELAYEYLGSKGSGIINSADSSVGIFFAVW